jgi:hypothetical protein
VGQRREGNMLSKPCTSAYALRIPALLIVLTAGVVPAGAQRVPVPLPAELTYVSLSGAVTLGFSRNDRNSLQAGRR